MKRKKKKVKENESRGKREIKMERERGERGMKLNKPEYKNLKRTNIILIFIYRLSTYYPSFSRIIINV